MSMRSRTRLTTGSGWEPESPGRSSAPGARRSKTRRSRWAPSPSARRSPPAQGGYRRVMSSTAPSWARISRRTRTSSPARRGAASKSPTSSEPVPSPCRPSAPAWAGSRSRSAPVSWWPRRGASIPSRSSVLSSPFSGRRPSGLFARPSRIRSEANLWVSRRTDYATRAILALAVADGGPLRLEEIADATDAPRSVLEQVMPTLRTAGVVRSVRGPHGGYRLNHTLEGVVRLFQGQLAPIGYATRRNPDPCPELVARTLRPVWEEVRDATISILEDTTFADLAKVAQRAPSRR